MFFSHALVSALISIWDIFILILCLPSLFVAYIIADYFTWKYKRKKKNFEQEFLECVRSMCPGSVLKISQLTADSLGSLVSSGLATSPSVSLRWQRGCMTAEETQLVNEYRHTHSHKSGKSVLWCFITKQLLIWVLKYLTEANIWVHVTDFTQSESKFGHYLLLFYYYIISSNNPSLENRTSNIFIINIFYLFFQTKNTNKLVRTANVLLSEPL